MTKGHPPRDPRRLTFSQAHGLEELPRRRDLGELSKELRILLWEAFDAATEAASQGIILFGPHWNDVVLSLARRYLHISSDELSYQASPAGFRATDARAVRDAFRPFFLGETPYNRVLDLVQDAMRHERCPPKYIAEITKAFEECDVAYLVDTSGPPTILPAATTEEQEAIRLAQQGLSDSGHSAAQTHLRRAGELFRDGKWRESVHQSISAVESVAKSIEPGETRLSKILAKLQDEAGLDIHPAFRSALQTLYGWASDEPGVRHGSSERVDRVGRAEAAFMISACAAFCTYLLEKQRAVTLTNGTGEGGG